MIHNDRDSNCKCVVFLHTHDHMPTETNFNYKYKTEYEIPFMSTCREKCVYQPIVLHNLARRSTFCNQRRLRNMEMVSIF